MKKKDIKSSLDFNIELLKDKILFNDIKFKVNKSYITSDIAFDKKPFTLLTLILNNNINNNYYLYLNSNLKKSTLDIEVKGSSINLTSLLSKNSNSSDIDLFDTDLYQNISLIAQVSNLKLLNNTSLEDVNIYLYCKKNNCSNSFLRANINKNDNINIMLSRDKNSKISGNISNLSLLARGFDISSQLIGGNIDIKAEIIPENYDQGRMIEGSIKINDKFYILKSEKFNKIAQEEKDLFDELNLTKSDKFTFNKLNSDFVFNDNIIEISDFLARTRFMGITLNGSINIEESAINLNGLIIPGYTVNNLFGIGSIPVIGKIITGEKGGGIFASKYSYIKKNER